MPRFTFKFEAVLKHRRLLEDEAQRDLAKVLRQRMIFADQLRQMQQSIADSRRQLGQGLVGQLQVDQIGQFARYSIQVRQRAQQLVGRLAGVEKHIEAARQRLIEAQRRRKALELLEQRQRRHWQGRQDRLENAALDEMAVQAYARSLMAGELE